MNLSFMIESRITLRSIKLQAHICTLEVKTIHRKVILANHGLSKLESFFYRKQTVQTVHSSPEFATANYF